MHSLVDDLRRAPTPEVFQSRMSLVQAMKRAHIAMVRASLGDSNTLGQQPDLVVLRDYALWLEGIAMKSDLESEAYCALAASIYEFTGTLTLTDGPIDIFTAPLNDLLRSAILSCLTAFQAQSTLIAGRVLAALRSLSPTSALERCSIVAALAIAALLARDFPTAFRHSRQLTAQISEIIEQLEAEHAQNAQKLHVDRLLAVGHASGLAALGMISGSESLLRHAIARLYEVRAKALERYDANIFWLADRLILAIQRMIGANIRLLLAPTHLPTVYADLLARDGYHEFWGPQLEAIRKGLLNPDRETHFVISVPTGSGKSLFAELSILNALSNDSDGWAVYIAPTRALVSQVSGELRHRLERCNITVRTIVAGAEQSAILDEELSLLGTTRSVTVTTPEKLDAYYRNARELFDTCKVIIFDEAHKIADAGRGAMLESLMTRFVMLQPGTQIVVLSGLMENATEIAAWLGELQTQVVATATRATRQIFGVTVRTDLVTADPPRNTTRGLSRRVWFNGGLVFVHEEDDLEQPLQVDFPTVFRGFYRERFNERWGRWREESSLEHSTTTDHAVSLAASWSHMGGPLLIFVSNARSAQKGCRDLLAATNAPSQEECVGLARYIEEELGEGHDLVEFCARGVAYHHARLPSNVQRAIELALQEGWLQAVFATPTLREGLNTAVRTVIVAGTHFYNVATQSQDDLGEADFLNIAGRAGRPRVDTEGRVILIPDSLVQASAVESGKKYILAGESVLRVMSQFRAVADDVAQCHGQFQRLTPGNQSLLLALEAAGLGEETQIADFLTSTLWSIQEHVRVPTETATEITVALDEARRSIGAERFSLAARLGLSLSSSERLYDVLSTNLHLFTSSSDDRRQAQITLLVQCALELPEIAQGELRNASPAAHVRALESWLAGDSYARILAVAIDGGTLDERDTVTDAVKYCSDMSTWLSWAFGAAFTILRTIIEEVDPYVGALPLLVRYGVPDIASAYVALLGVSDRTASRNIAQVFVDSGRPLGLAEISRWLSEGDVKDLLPDEDEDSVRLQLIRRYLSRRRYGDDPFVQFRFDAFESVRLGAVFTCQVDGEYLVWFDGTRRLATTPFDARARALVKSGSERVIGVVSEVAHNRRSGSLVAVSET